MKVTIVCHRQEDDQGPDLHFIGFNIASGAASFRSDSEIAMEFCDRTELTDLDTARENLRLQGYRTELHSVDDC